MGNMKSMGGESKGYGAARTWGMGLQDEQLVRESLWIITKILNIMNYGNIRNYNIRFKYRWYN